MESLGTADYQLKTFLTTSQQRAFYRLDRRLQSRLKSRLSVSGGDAAIRTVRRVADLCAKCRADLQVAADRFFLVVLEKGGDEANELLARVVEIGKINGVNAFFECASTLKRTWYPFAELSKIASAFSAVPNRVWKGRRGRFPQYDRGGKETLVELVGRKKELKAKMRPARYLSFSKQEDELLQYLKAKPEGERLDLAIYRQCFAGIRNSSRCQPLSEAERCGLAWVIAVGVESPHYGLKDLEKVVKSACALRAEEGEGRLVDFCGAPSWKEPVSLRDCARALDLLTTFFENGEQWSEVDHLFDQFYNGKHSLEDLVEALVKMQVVDEKLHLRDASAVKKLLERLHKEDFPLTDKQIEQLGEFYERVDEYYRKWADCSMAEWVRMASQIRTESDGIDTDKTLQLVAIAKHVMRIQFKITLHPTQICTVLGKLLPGNRTGCLAQVKTGEGKSYIVTLLAFVLSMQNLGVHIVSSNQGLAKRDQQDGFSFFGRFGISTGHICVNFPEASQFLPDILYGTAADFEFAIMRELLDGCSLFSESLGREKRFDCVIVDEVDNLTIDTMLNKARLSQMAEESYEWVYEPIWRFVQGEAVDKSVKALRIFLKGYRKGCFRGKVPSLTDKQLMNWMLNAVKAGRRRRKTDYIIKPREDGRLRIVIVDVNNTGELMESCRWGGGLHEFVEIKHGIPVQKEGIVPISMSHAVFYPMYKKIFGLSGTVGSEDDRDELKLVYELCAFDMPTNLPCLRRDAPARTVASKEELHAQALKQIEECREAGRPILVLCRSIKKTEEFKEILDREEIPCKLLNENQKESEKEVLEGAGLPGAVTIATNVAGRGTDIKLKGASEKNGGLHVLITFQSHSKRVEWQARGRAGRQGKPGSSEVVSLGGQKLGSTPQERIKRAKMERACHVLVEAFYARISAFEQSLVKRGRLNALVVELGNRQLKNRPQPVEKMHEKDRILGEQAIELLCSSEASEAAWRALLQLIVKRVKERAITRWYCDFYQDVIDGGYEGTIAEMRALFTKHMKEQEVRLDPLGRGLIAYLREVTGAKLPHVGPSSELK